uniref:Uncharacterized protein n=1 Tax=Fibrocapsa japonica TaxID=94617 RepID=A0A6U1MVE0_9STRA|eukprot:CAMPEP_0113943342 /NCGR_PEP_ID=MMETSP1339-20121228/23194_1 /TAXON_ID=94617 /ORGANISM="Fibrocapsa japonica" /LENGTH=122 /DNA_ID=CAMNT_0000948187 /DNA_START=107 /DNA_END=475 /DNA_ORIENTATION=+ /assembly_acc=CAM_ASM_000762
MKTQGKAGFKSTSIWTNKISRKAAIYTTTIAGGAVVGCYTLPGLAWAVGLSKIGPVAGGMFASMQSAGWLAGTFSSVMSGMQSVAMGGAWSTAVSTATTAAGGLAGAATPLLWRKVQKRSKL